MDNGEIYHVDNNGNILDKESYMVLPDDEPVSNERYYNYIKNSSKFNDEDIEI